MSTAISSTKNAVKSFQLFVVALLNELSDQNAYQRHLAAHGTAHSPQEWRNFCDEHWRKQSRRGRCC